MSSQVERILACPVLLLLTGSELILAIIALLGLGFAHGGGASFASPDHPRWGLLVACLLCLLLALWGIATLVGMIAETEFARRSMRFLGAAYAALGAFLLLFGIYEGTQTSAARLSSSPLKYTFSTLSQPSLLWVYVALLAVGLWWAFSFRRPQSCRLG